MYVLDGMCVLGENVGDLVVEYVISSFFRFSEDDELFSAFSGFEVFDESGDYAVFEVSELREE